MLRYGLKHGATIKPKENEVFALAEEISDQINRKGLCKDNLNSVQRLKNPLRAFLLTYLILMINQFTETQENLKLIKDILKDLAVLKPDKVNGVVLISNSDYYQSLKSLLFDNSKFRLIDKDPTFTQLSSRTHLRTLLIVAKLMKINLRNSVLKML